MSLALVVVLLLTSLLLALVLREVFLGYPPEVMGSRWLSAKEQAVTAAAAQTLFPAGGVLPSGVDAGTVGYFDHMMGELQPVARFQIHLLLFFVEHAPTVLALRPRFTRMTASSRVALLRAWSRSSIYFLRVVFTSLRTLLCIGYMADDGVLDRLGAQPKLDPFGVGLRARLASTSEPAASVMAPPSSSVEAAQ